MTIAQTFLSLNLTNMPALKWMAETDPMGFGTLQQEHNRILYTFSDDSHCILHIAGPRKGHFDTYAPH